jgi:hypothetical protein
LGRGREPVKSAQQATQQDNSDCWKTTDCHKIHIAGQAVCFGNVVIIRK